MKHFLRQIIVACLAPNDCGLPLHIYEGSTFWHLGLGCYIMPSGLLKGALRTKPAHVKNEHNGILQKLPEIKKHKEIGCHIIAPLYAEWSLHAIQGELAAALKGNSRLVDGSVSLNTFGCCHRGQSVLREHCVLTLVQITGVP